MNEHSTKILANLGIEAAEPVAMCTSPQAGAELFVINLCASMTPMPEVPKSLKGFEAYKLYQVSKMEDGRRRYRLRLGFFTSEADAEMVVGSVRNIYPAAFTGCLSAEDLRYTGGFQARALPKEAPAPIQKPIAAAQPAPVSIAKPAPVNKPQIAAPSTPTAPATIKAAPAVAPLKQTAAPPAVAVKPAQPTAAPPTTIKVTKPAVPPPQKPVAPTELTLELDLSKKPEPATAAPVTSVVPFHVAKGIEVPEVSLELAPDATPAPKKPSTPANPTAMQTTMAAAMATNKMPAAVVAPPAGREVIPPPPRVVDDYVPILDTTLTLRTLTQAEIEDPNAPAWFVVELALSDHPVNLDTMPKLDIFTAYTLYSVAITNAGTIRHALRLGFFREAISAEAVAGYLKTFFPTPNVTRISGAEHTRFAEQPRKPAAPSGQNTADKVVQLNDKRTAALLQTPTRAPKPAAPANKPIAKPAAAVAKKPMANAKAPIAQKGSSRSLSAQLMEEARQVMLSESGIRKAPAKPQSFLSRLIGRSLD